MDPATVERLVDLVLALDAAGVQGLRAEGDRLRFWPASMVPPELLFAIREKKAGLLAALSPGRPTTGPTEPTEAPFGSSAWQLRPDVHGRPGLEAPDLPDQQRWWAQGDFDALPEPGEPCPRCGSLETWWDGLDDRHCQRCEAAGLETAHGLASRAARLRRAGLAVARNGKWKTDRTAAPRLRANRPA